MITPLDIQNKEFKRTIFGYSAKTVDTFLDEIIIDYERIYKENIELKDKINLLSDQKRIKFFVVMQTFYKSLQNFSQILLQISPLKTTRYHTLSQKHQKSLS